MIKKSISLFLCAILLFELVPFSYGNSHEEHLEKSSSFNVEVPLSETTIKNKIVINTKTEEVPVKSAVNTRMARSVSAMSATDSSAFNTLYAPSAMNNLYNKQYAMTDSEGISPLTGDLTKNETDLSLPGRNGLDLSIGRIYQSNQALLGERKINKKNHAYQTTSTYLNDRYYLGIGWSFTFPSVEVKKEDIWTERYYHNGFGKVERVVITPDPNDSNLDKHYEKDAMFNMDTAYNNGQVQSAYSYTTAAKTKQYFSADGRYMGSVDRYGNKINVTHTMTSINNILPNYDFTYNSGSEVIGWDAYAKTSNLYTLDTTDGKGDSNSLKYSSNQISSRIPSSSMYVEVESDRNYKLEFYGKNQLSSDASIVGISEYSSDSGSSDSLIKKEEMVLKKSNIWEKYELNFTTNSRTRYVRVYFLNSGEGTSRIDKVRVGEVHPLIKEITDSLGRKINFSYSSGLYEIGSSEEDLVTIEVKEPKDDKIIRLNYTKGRLIQDIDVHEGLYIKEKYLYRERRLFPYLKKVESLGNTTAYGYEFKSSDYNYSRKNLKEYPWSGNQYLLSEVNQNNKKTKYVYESTIKNLGPDGSYNTWRINSRADYPRVGQSYHLAKAQFKQAYKYACLNDTRVYDNETAYPDNVDIEDKKIRQITYMYQENGLNRRWEFEGGKIKKVSTMDEKGNGETKTYEEYHSVFKDSPLKVKYSTQKIKVKEKNTIPKATNIDLVYGPPVNEKHFNDYHRMALPVGISYKLDTGKSLYTPIENSNAAEERYTAKMPAETIEVGNPYKIKTRSIATVYEYAAGASTLLSERIANETLMDKGLNYVKNIDINTENDADQVAVRFNRHGDPIYGPMDYTYLKTYITATNYNSWCNPNAPPDRKAYFIRKGNLYSYSMAQNESGPKDYALSAAQLEATNVDLLYKNESRSLYMVYYKDQQYTKIFYNNSQARWNTRYQYNEGWTSYNEYVLPGKINNFLVYNTGKSPRYLSPGNIAPLVIEIGTENNTKIRVFEQVLPKERNIIITKLPENYTPIIFANMERRTREDIRYFDDIYQNVYIDNESSITSYYLSPQGDIYSSEGVWDSNNNLIFKKLSEGLNIKKIFAHKSRFIDMMALSEDGKIYLIKIGSAVSTVDNTPKINIDLEFAKEPEVIEESVLYVENTYNDWGGVASTTKPLMAEQLVNANEKAKYTTAYEYNPTYKAISKVTSYQNEGTKITLSNTYDSLGNVLETIKPDGERVAYTYGLSAYPGLVSSVKTTRLNGTVNKVDYSYDSTNAMYQPVELKTYYTALDGSANVSTSKLGYDLMWGVVNQSVDPNGNVTKYSFNTEGRLESIEGPKLTDQNGDYYIKETYSYNPSVYTEGVNQNSFEVLYSKERVSSSGGLSTVYDRKKEHYNAYGYLNMSEQSLTELGQPSRSVYQYDNYGQLISARDPNGNTTSFSVDSLGRTTGIRDAYNNQYLLSYDDIARSKTTLFQASNEGTAKKQLHETYDQWGRVVSRKAYPTGTDTGYLEESYQYDYQDNIVVSVNPNKHRTEFKYSAIGQLVQVKEANGDISDYSYYSTDQLSEQRQYVENQMLSKKKLYDERGIIQKSIEADGKVTSYLTNGLGQIIEIQNGSSPVERFAYDALGRITNTNIGDESKRNQWGVYGIESIQLEKAGTVYAKSSYSYNPRGLISEKTEEGKLQKYEYDLAGSVTKLTTASGQVLEYSYDKRNLVSAIKAGSKTFEYSYNADGTLKSTKYPVMTNGEVLRSEYKYDNAKRVIEIAYYKNNNVFIKYNYEYDANGNRIKESVNDRETRRYQYDAKNQLIQTSYNGKDVRTYSYDSRGNRLKATGPVTELKSNAEADYSWNVWGKLNSVSYDQTTAVSYKYGASGLRTEKTADGKSTKYDYDGAGRVVTEYDENGVAAENIWGNGILARKVEGKLYYYMTNAHGDVTAVISESGEVVNEYEYDEWGNVLKSREDIENPIRYSGEYYDEETDLYYLRARYYDPSLGKFISKDSYEGGVSNPQSLNQYIYCENNPVMFVDPTGNTPQAIGKLFQAIFTYLLKTVVETAPDVTIDMMIDGKSFDFKKSFEFNYFINLIPILGEKVTETKLLKYLDEVGKGAGNLDGVKIINKKYAGQVYELSGDLGKKYSNGVRFTKEGFPDFSQYSIKTVKIDGLQGDAYYDFIKANQAAGYKTTPKGYTWHHVEDGTTMMLVPTDLHGAVRHTGGASLIRQGIMP